MHFDSRIPAFWATSLSLILLSMMVNSRLAAFSLYLVLMGPVLVMPALNCKSPALILYSFVTGLLVDILLPLPFWLFVYGFPIIGLLIRAMRSHFRTETSYRRFFLAHIANLACITLLCISQGIYFSQNFDSLPQILAIILLSHTILCIVTPWFFSLEQLFFQLLGIEYPHEDKPSAL